MPRSRTRSRSRRRVDRGHDRDRKDDSKRDEPSGRQEGKADTGKSGNSEQEIVSVAIRQLAGDIRGRLEKLFNEGLLKEGDLDLRAITVFASLNEGLQSRVMNFVENERIYVANARSKSGFLIATCDKAKTGCLDARGLGAIDPWRTALVAMATPKQKMVELKPESEWLDQHQSDNNIKINVNVQVVESELGVPIVTLELPLSESVAAVKAKLVAMGVKSIPANRMKLHTEPAGFLKECHSFAYYNLQGGVTLALSERKRAGVRFRSDHTAMPKQPQTRLQPGEAASSPADALQKLVNSAPKLPALPAWPKLPGLPSPEMPSGFPVPGGGMGARMQATGPGSLNALLGSSGTRPTLIPNLPLSMRAPGGGGSDIPGGLQLPSKGGIGDLTLPKLLDAKAAGMSLSSMPMGGTAATSVAGGLPLTMPGTGNLPKALAGLPWGMGGPPPGVDMTMPTAPSSMGGAAPKVQSKSQMPGGTLMAGAIPKMQGFPLTGMGDGSQQPFAPAAVAAATTKAAAPA